MRPIDNSVANIRLRLQKLKRFLVIPVILDGFLNFFLDADNTAANDLAEIACRMLPLKGKQIVYRFVIKIFAGDPEVAVTVPVENIALHTAVECQ